MIRPGRCAVALNATRKRDNYFQMTTAATTPKWRFWISMDARTPLCMPSPQSARKHIASACKRYVLNKRVTIRAHRRINRWLSGSLRVNLTRRSLILSFRRYQAFIISHETFYYMFIYVCRVRSKIYVLFNNAAFEILDMGHEYKFIRKFDIWIELLI